MTALNTCIMKYQFIALLFLITSCRKLLGPYPKLDDSCDRQYTISKKLNVGDSLVVPTCDDSVSFTFLRRKNSVEYNAQFKMIVRSLSDSSTWWIAEHNWYRVLLFNLKIEKYKDTSVKLMVWYNHLY